MPRALAVLLAGFPLAAVPAVAADHPVAAKKLVVVDKLAASGKAKVAFVAKDGDITKGAGTDRTTVTATLDVAFGSVRGAFLLPQGDGWVTNNAKVAKYVSKSAPAGGAVSVGVVKDGTLAKVVARSLGDEPLDVSSPPGDPVAVALTVVNGGETNRHCTAFADCLHKAVAHGAGHKLVCRGGAPDPACAALPPPPPVAYSVDCCQGAGECTDGYGFSLSFYLYNFCQSALPGSDGVYGGSCGMDGICHVASFPPRTICCQYSEGCYDGTPVSSTAAVWSFRNYCVGAQLGTAYFDAVCDVPSGACLAE